MSKVAWIVSFVLKPGKCDEFLQVMRSHASRTLEHEEGCLHFDVCLPREGPENTVWLYELYRDEAAFEVHKASPILAETRAKYPDLIESRTIEVCDVA